MKNYIQVNNFRKYISTPEIELQNLNFLVGTNSSGKSTLVKAFLLISSYLQSSDITEIDLASKEYSRLNILNYEDLKSKFSSIEDKIEIKIHVGNFIVILILKEGDNTNKVKVLKCSITDLANDVEAFYEFKKGNEKFYDVPFDLGNGFEVETVKNIEEEILYLRFFNISKVKKNILNTLEYELKNEESKILRILLEKEKKAFEEYDFEDEIIIESTLFSNSSFGVVVNDIGRMANFSPLQNFRIFDIIIDENKTIDDALEFKVTKIDLLMRLEEILFNDFNKNNSIVKFINRFQVNYYPLYFKKYTRANSISDTSNDLALLLHEYVNFKGDNKLKEITDSFIKQSLMDFNIGEDFTINSILGEIYEVIIHQNNIRISLSDKGTGNIQIFKMLLSLANSTLKYKDISEAYSMIVIEEPEINLHPALQSKLADLFNSISLLWKSSRKNINLMIETHSEYLIRRLQVLSIQNKLDRNNLSITYFPTELNQDPYQLRINKDGSLDKNFGSGFFDEAGNHMLELMRFNLTSKN